VPAIAKTAKKAHKTYKVSLNKGKDDIIDNTKTCRPLMEVTALKGLKTLNALNEFRDKPSSPAFSAVISFF
jgi:dynactin complex subunit